MKLQTLTKMAILSEHRLLQPACEGSWVGKKSQRESAKEMTQALMGNELRTLELQTVLLTNEPSLQLSPPPHITFIKLGRFAFLTSFLKARQKEMASVYWGPSGDSVPSCADWLAPTKLAVLGETFSRDL